MVVDDSAVARGFLRRWIEVEPGIEIVAALRTGREALDYFERADPDVVVLDIEMPDMDGITALPLLLAKKPGLAVIMASTLTRRNAEVTLRALSLGALDCVQKPDAQGPMTSETYRQYLISKIRELGKRTRQGVRTPDRPHAVPLVRRRLNPVAAGKGAQSPAIALRPMPVVTPRVLVVGASTGGPQALTELCGKLGSVIDHAPVLITQHMPPTFTTILAEHLARATGRPAKEAVDGEPIRAGHIYVAPGNRHLRVARVRGEPVAMLDDSPPLHFCKPAVDIMFSSAADVWGGWVLGVVLTGMGSDGLNGANDIVASGGCVIAQDEATSVVWGMPGSVAEAGLCSRVLPLLDIAPTVSRLFLGRRP
ncbi:MAG: chemotaxis response regulator protein-glutamate methylesterase [Pseudorhodoplanes sp.]